MISLTIPAEFSDPKRPSFVARLSHAAGPDLALLAGELGGHQIFQIDGQTISIATPGGSTLMDDVVYFEPAYGRASRWIRANSAHNTLLVTERCDQLCIMCSQPPKKSHIDMFTHMKKACLLAPKNMMIGFSGGEPLLFKDQLLALIENVYAQRPDLSFHVLTNAQHFREEDIIRLRGEAFRSVLWGVPLYASSGATHDRIVGKQGAFDTLMTTLPMMARAGLQIELRTVLLKQNFGELSALSGMVSARLPFITVWAIMQLERIGFARTRWHEQFIDHSAHLPVLEAAVAEAVSRGTRVSLYNMPYCTVSQSLRSYLSQSISDWKRAFPESCKNCSAKPLCTGFFEWHNTLEDYAQGGAL